MKKGRIMEERKEKENKMKNRARNHGNGMNFKLRSCFKSCRIGQMSSVSSTSLCKAVSFLKITPKTCF
jgi:hypothetical protein